MLRTTYGIGFAVVLMGTISPAAFAAGIGTITDVVNQAYHTPPGATEVPAKVDDELVTDETLRTEENSTISVRFVDGSELSVEAGSELVLSDYVFDEQTTTASSGVIQLDNGQFHYNSNGNDDSKIALQTPVATIGIRGTEFLVTVGKDVTVVDVVDGSVQVTPHGGGKAVICEGGQSILATAGRDDAICGDYGSFSTAAGVPAAAPPTLASGESHANPHGAPSHDDPPDPPKGGGGGDPGEPPSDGGNHSGLGDGSNPGKGHGHGHDDGGNGGSNNPGGGNK